MHNDLIQNNDYIHPSNLPNSTATLVLGILSLVLSVLMWCFFYLEIIPLALGIIGLVMGNKDRSLYLEATDFYTKSSISSSNAGWVCSIIGIIVSSLILLGFLFLFLIAGSLSYNNFR